MTRARDGIRLDPGEYYFGRGDQRIRTLLGSCVAVTLWHPPSRTGGMCHFLLPRRPRGPVAAAPDPRYGDEAVALLLRDAVAAGNDPSEHEIKVFGGANVLPQGAVEHFDVGARNVTAALGMLSGLGLRIQAQHVLGCGHRNIVFDLSCGTVWVQHTAPAREATGAGT